MTWLITGGAGYIGAHVVRAMTEAGEKAVVYDDLSTGIAERVPDGVPWSWARSWTANASRAPWPTTRSPASCTWPPRSRSASRWTCRCTTTGENVEGLRVLLEAVTAAGVPSFVFSSSAAVYGMPDVDLVTEETPCLPMSPYGETKLAGEWLVRATGRASGLSTASLRYFNVAGAASPELADTGVYNLVPMVFEKLTEGAAPRVFGDDYATPDGTCVRDYIHVVDLAEAHVAAARALQASPGSALTLNIGRGEGVSVREMIDRINSLTGHDHPPTVTPPPRRPGPRGRLADRAAVELDWKAKYDVEDMITSAWAGWVRLHPGAARD